MTRAEAKRRVIRFAASLLQGSHGLKHAAGLYADGMFHEVGPDDAERLSRAIDEFIAELERRGQEPEDVV
jgi:hypothetical protein